MALYRNGSLIAIYSKSFIAKSFVNYNPAARAHDTRHNDIQYNGTEHNDIKYNGTEHNDIR